MTVPEPSCRGLISWSATLWPLSSPTFLSLTFLLRIIDSGTISHKQTKEAHALDVCGTCYPPAHYASTYVVSPIQ